MRCYHTFGYRDTLRRLELTYLLQKGLSARGRQASKEVSCDTSHILNVLLKI